MTFPVLTAAEAASLIHHGQNVGFSGFTPAGAPKAIPLAIAERAIAAHDAGQEFQIGILTGASTGPSLDGALAKAQAIKFRTPYQTNADLRDRINAGQTRFFDLHLSLMPQVTRDWMRPSRPSQSEAAAVFSCGTRWRGWERARWNSRCGSGQATSRMDDRFRTAPRCVRVGHRGPAGGVGRGR